MAAQCGIYKIESKLNGYAYIGSSADIAHRWRMHISSLKNKKHHSIILQNHVGKYGIEDLLFQVLEITERSLLITREQYYIDTENSKFNVRRVADSNVGIKRSRATKEKLRYINLGRKLSEETKKKMSERMKGNRFTLGVTPVNARKIICIKTGAIFNSIDEAAKIIGIKRTTLGEQLRGKNKNKTTLKYL